MTKLQKIRSLKYVSFMALQGQPLSHEPACTYISQDIPYKLLIRFNCQLTWSYTNSLQRLSKVGKRSKAIFPKVCPCFAGTNMCGTCGIQVAILILFLLCRKTNHKTHVTLVAVIHNLVKCFKDRLWFPSDSLCHTAVVSQQHFP